MLCTFFAGGSAVQREKQEPVKSIPYTSVDIANISCAYRCQFVAIRSLNRGALCRQNA